jgi:HEPN domain-containing protein
VTSDRLARDYLHRARARRKALDALMGAAAHADVVRQSQDAVELLLKGALRFVGVDPPKRHDVHRILEQFLDRFPPEWRAVWSELRAKLDELAQERGPAFYGDEDAAIPASELFGHADAGRALAIVDRLLDLCGRLLGPGE